jgi:hypothetical protein
VTGLFRIFAETAPTAEGVLAFANRYGRLGWSLPLPMDPASSAEPDVARRPAEPESLWQWQGAIAWFKDLVSLWELAGSGDSRAVGEAIQWRDSDALVYLPPTGDASVPSAGGAPADAPRRERARPVLFLRRATDQQLMDQIPAGDVIQPAMIYVERILNKVLRAHVYPELLRDPALDRPTLRWLPQHLLGAMCLQFAEAISFSKQYRQCRECDRWFEVAPGVNRRSRLTCSDACRNRGYRERQGRARELRARGKSVGEIANVLGADPAAVKGWVKGVKKQE